MCRWLMLALLLALATWTSRAEPIDPSDVYVVDGDTIAVFHMQPKVRLVGFNAPESSNAACEAQRQLGVKAAQRLFELVRAGHLDFEYVECSCPAKTHGTRFCNYGRDCGTLKSNGRDSRRDPDRGRARGAVCLRPNALPEETSAVVSMEVAMRKLIFALLLVLATPAHGEPTPGDHIPAQFHGLWCGDPDHPDLPYTRARGTECPARSGEAQLSITADTVESTETRCKVLTTAYDKRAKELRTTKFCWYTVNDPADTKNGSVMISRYSIRNGKLHVIDKADAQ